MKYFLSGLAAPIVFALNASDLGVPVVSLNNNSIETALRFFFGLAGALAVLFIAIGGFRYTTSGGDPQGIQQAKNTILYAVIGLVLAMLAQFIIGFVISTV